MMGEMKRKIKDSSYIQLDLIPLTEIEKLYKEFSEVKNSADKVRRGIFAKQTDLAKKVEDLTCQLETLQSQMIKMHEWIMKKLGLLENVHFPADGSLSETTSLHITKINAAYAEKLHPSHISEIMDINILIA